MKFRFKYNTYNKSQEKSLLQITRIIPWLRQRYNLTKGEYHHWSTDIFIGYVDMDFINNKRTVSIEFRKLTKPRPEEITEFYQEHYKR